MIKLKKTVLGLINKGSSRSITAKKNIIKMMICKGGNILVGLALVPLTINYVDAENYGIWMALSSMVAWMSFFDIGINNGLRNKLAEAFANGDYNAGKKLVSTAYAVLCSIFLPLMVIGIAITPFIDWSNLLNLSIENNKLVYPIVIIIAYFCIQFILSTINVVMMADQQPADAALRSFLQQLASLVVIGLLIVTTEGSLLYLCIGLCLAPIAILAIFNYTLFKGRYKEISPSLSHVDKAVVPDLMNLGIKFFIIQIAGVIQYQMINFLVIRYYGATEVASYNISYRYFSVLNMLWGIVIAPLWTAVTDAKSRGDFLWIKTALTKYQLLFCGGIAVGIVMLLISSFVYRLWIGDAVDVPFTLSLWVLLYCVSMVFSSMYVYILNGAGILNVQTYCSIISPIVFLLTFFLLYNLGVGVYGILVAAIISNFNGILIAPIQCWQYINHNNVSPEKNN